MLLYGFANMRHEHVQLLVCRVPLQETRMHTVTRRRSERKQRTDSMFPWRRSERSVAEPLVIV